MRMESLVVIGPMAGADDGRDKWGNRADDRRDDRGREDWRR